MEREIKLTAAEDRLFSAFNEALSCYGASASPETHEMHSVYYDFPDYSLRKNGLSVRFRADNNAGYVTVKTGGANDGGVQIRSEWERPCDSLSSGLSLLPEKDCLSRILSLGRPEDLRPIAEIYFTRVCFTARTDGAAVEFALDRGFFNGDRNKRFAELEAELKSGSIDALKLISSRLADKYSLTFENNSKLARAISDAAGLT